MDPNTTQQAVFQYQLISTVASLAALAASFAAIIKSYRREPPLSEQVLEKFATKNDLKELREDLEKTRDGINLQLRSGDKCFKDLERVIGKLEAMFSICPYMCGRKPPQ
jgi:5-bromo-4-chloroindolyl phosphate hydrolysis protein